MGFVLMGLFCGLLTGVISGLFGIGGGIILVPMLTMFFSYTQHAAVGTSLTAMLLPVGLLGVYEYYRLGKITSDNLKFGLLIAVGIFVGTYLGSMLSVNLPATLLKRLFAIFLVLVSLKMWFTS